MHAMLPVKFIAGLLYANAGEWVLHKHVLHGLGRSKGSFWSFHWYDHHRSSRRNDCLDEGYERSLLSWSPEVKEIASLLGLAVVHLPVMKLSRSFYAALLLSEIGYYVLHRAAHTVPDFCRDHLPWHYDHHMGRNQDANWCVTFPLFDAVMGTRERRSANDRPR